MEIATVEIDGQYQVLRGEAGWLRRGERRLLAVSGADAAEFLQGQLTNDVEGPAAGEGRYAALLDRKGGIHADLRVLRLGPGEYLLETEEAGIEVLRKHLTTYRLGSEVEIEDAGLGLISVIGPAAAQATGSDPGAEHSHAEVELGGSAVRALRSDSGIDLIGDEGAIEAVAQALAAAKIPEVSLEAAEIIRVERGRPRFGHEIEPGMLPHDAGIVERAVDFEKGCYIGQEPVARLHHRGKPNRFLRGLRLGRLAAHGDEIATAERAVGTVGTALVSPAHGPIGLAVIRREAAPGDRVSVGGGEADAEVIEPPFEKPA